MIGINMSTYLNSSIPVDIGCQYEDETRYVYFDLTPLVTAYGDGTFKIFYKSDDHSSHQMANTSRVLNIAKGVLTRTETLYSGYGEMELIFYPSNTTGSVPDNYRLPIVRTYLSPSL